MQRTEPAGKLLVFEDRRGAGSATDRHYVRRESDISLTKMSRAGRLSTLKRRLSASLTAQVEQSSGEARRHRTYSYQTVFGIAESAYAKQQRGFGRRRLLPRINAIGDSETLVRPFNSVYLSFRVLYALSLKFFVIGF